MPEGFPVVIALLDTFCDRERLECMTNAMVASLDALHPSTLLGIISFDDHVGHHLIFCLRHTILNLRCDSTIQLDLFLDAVP